MPAVDSIRDVLHRVSIKALRVWLSWRLRTQGRPRRTARTGVLAVLVLLGASGAGLSQNAFDLGTPAESKGGLASLSTYAQDKIEVINLASGTLSLHIPLVTIGGRGTASHTIALSHNSKLWAGQQDIEIVDDGFGHTFKRSHFAATYDDSTMTKPNLIPLGAGWSISKGPAIKVRKVEIQPLTAGECQPSQGTRYKYVLTKVWVVLPDGSEVELRDELTDGAPFKVQDPCNSPAFDRDRGQVWRCVDGSAITYVTDAQNGVVSGQLEGWVFLSDGTRLSMSGAILGGGARCRKILDPNGNVLDILYDTPSTGAVTYRDQLGRDVILQSTTSGATVTIKGYSGVSDRTFTITTDEIGATVGGNPVNLRSDYWSLQRPFLSGDFDVALGPGFHAYGSPHTDLFWDQQGGDVGSDLYAGFTEIDIQPAVTQLSLLDGRTFRFRYNPFGELAEIVYPGGGVSQIDYSPFGSSMCDGGGILIPMLNRRVTERHLLADGQTVDATWTYSRAATVVTVEAHQGSGSGPLLMSEKHYFMALDAEYRRCSQNSSDGTGYEKWENAKEIKVERDTGTGLLKEERVWAQRANVVWPADPGSSVNAYVQEHGQENPTNDTRMTREDSILEDNKLKRVTYGYDGFNNVTSIVETDWGANLTPGPNLRETTRTYVGLLNGYCYTNLNGTAGTCAAAPSSDASAVIHMRRLLLTEEIKNAGGTREAYTEVEYDNYTIDANHAPIQVNSGMTGYNGNRFALFDSQFEPRGNATKVSRWIEGRGLSSTFSTSFTQYDNAGNVIKTKDPRGHVTTISYVDNFGSGDNPDSGLAGNAGPTFALPGSVTNPLGQVVKTQYSFTRGVPTGVKDANGAITKTEYDSYDRPTRVTAALGLAEQTVTEMSYPMPGSNTSSRSSQLDGTRWVSGRTMFDGFGRPVLESAAEDGLHFSSSAFTIHTKTVFDGLGRARMATNPHRATPAATDGWTRTVYDRAGRMTEVATFSQGPNDPPPDSGTSDPDWTGSVTTTYNANETTVRDQDGKQRRSRVDGLGRLTAVDELFTNGTVYATTTYGYDARGNLKTVTQGVQTRSFVYDGLSRLTSATNPESGAYNYQYDPASNLDLKTHAGGLSVDYDYDSLNRVQTITYNDGTPQVTYVYDTATKGVGRVTSVTATGVSAFHYTTYDALGRPIAYKQATAGQDYLMSAAYNKASLMTSEIYPSGREIVTDYDGAGRIAGVKKQDGTYYAGAAPTDTTNRIKYTAHGAMSEMKLGNGLWEHSIFNGRLQPTQIGLGSTMGASNVLGLGYTYGTNTNNGNVATQSITSPGLNLTQTYSYDHLNRLSEARENAGTPETWKHTYDYDRFGNRAVRPGSFIPTPMLTPQLLTDFSVTNNRIVVSGFGYDSRGNLIGDPSTGSNGMSYDGENRLKTYTKAGVTTSYAYDGDGRRVKKVVGTGPSAVTTVFVYNVSGQLIAEYTDPSQPIQGGGGTSYLTSDHWGSTRVVTDAVGGVKARHDYLPFGEELGAGIGGRTTGMKYDAADSTKQRFTQKERDVESGLDYFLARYYSASQGRFTSPDEFRGGPDELYFFVDDAAENPLFYADLANPQSLNKYQYCYDNPLRFIDPDGHAPGDDRMSRTLKGASKGAAIGGATGAVAGAVLGGGTGAVVGGAAGTLVAPGPGTGGGAVVGGVSGATQGAAIGLGLGVIGGAIIGGVIEFFRGDEEPKPTTDSGSEAQAQPQAEPQAPTTTPPPPPLQPQKIDRRSGKPKKETSLEGRRDTQESMSKAQARFRKWGKPDKIGSKKKTDQNLDNALKQVKKLKDVENN